MEDKNKSEHRKPEDKSEKQEIKKVRLGCIYKMRMGGEGMRLREQR